MHEELERMIADYREALIKKREARAVVVAAENALIAWFHAHRADALPLTSGGNLRVRLAAGRPTYSRRNLEHALEKYLTKARIYDVLQNAASIPRERSRVYTPKGWESKEVTGSQVKWSVTTLTDTDGEGP